MTGYTNLYLYKNTKFYKHQNYKIDDINSFLATLQLDKLTFENLQYFRPDSLQKELKIPFNQKGIKALHKYNYARVVIFNADHTQEWELFYFVDKIEWVSSDCIRLKMTNDTLNSFLDDLEFHPKTMIEREHTDRWDYSGYIKDTTTNKITLLRSIPDLNEGINPQKHHYVYSNDSLRYDVVRQYSIRITIDEATFENINISGKGYQILENNSITYNDSLFAPLWCVVDIGDNETAKTYSFIFPYALSGFQDFYKFYVDIGGTPTLISSSKDIPLDRPDILKISVIPYVPLTNLKNWKEYDEDNPYPSQKPITTNLKYDFQENNISLTGIAFLQDASTSKQLKDASSPIISEYISKDYSLSNIETFNELPKRLLTLENISYSDILTNIVDNGKFRYFNYSNESSMYSSEFLDLYFFYDSFDYKFNLEDIKFNGTQENFAKLFDYEQEQYPFLSIKFQISVLMDSGFTFEFLLGKYFEESSPIDIQNKNIMYCSMNNKRPTFESSYLNYMRNGYNYDIKLRDVGRMQRENEWQHQSTMWGSTLPKKVINPLNWVPMIIQGDEMTRYHEQSEYLTRMQEDLQMEKNQAQLKAQKLGVDNVSGGIEKTLEMNAFGKLSCVIRAPRKTWWKYIEDYFYFYGNKVQYYGVPTHNNRCLFDYLKCRAEFINRNNVPNEEALQDIIARLNGGVTFIHKYLNQYTFDSDYKENVENRLLEIIQGE